MARDDNGNPTAVEYRQTADAAEPDWSLDLAWDELDRLVRRQVGDDAPRRYRHNAIGQVTGHVTRHRARHPPPPRRARPAGRPRLLGPGVPGVETRRRGPVDRPRASSSTTRSGWPPRPTPPATGRSTATTRSIARSASSTPTAPPPRPSTTANGNVVRVVDQNGNETVNRFDAANRLVERRHRLADATEPLVERFEFDPVGRLIAASGPGGTHRPDLRLAVPTTHRAAGPEDRPLRDRRRRQPDDDPLPRRGGRPTTA